MNVRDLFLNWLLPKIFDYRDVTHDGELCLRRYFLKGRGTASQWFLHNIRKPDPDRAFHDRPWDFKTWVLAGWYVEEFPRTPEGWQGRALDIGQSQAFKAEQLHRISAVASSSCWTLVNAGRARRVWGFKEGGRWRSWRDFLHLYCTPEFKEDAP